jgi:hypothetical protein
MFGLVGGLQTYDVDIPYCFSSHNNRPIDSDKICNSKPIYDWDTFNEKDAPVIQASLHVRMDYRISGQGFVCKKIKRTITYPRYVFSFDSIYTEYEPIELSKLDCEYMNKSKICDTSTKTIMNCSSDNFCTYKKLPKIEQNWLTAKVNIDFECELTPRSIQIQNTEDFLPNTKCVYKDFGCLLNRFETLIWDRSVFHICPLQLIGYGGFVKNGNWLLNHNSKIALKTLEKIRICEEDLFLTEEGIYVEIKKEIPSFHIKDYIKKMPLIISNASNINILADLQLADQDYNTLSELIAHDILKTQECNTLKLLLSVIKTNDISKFKIIDNKNKPIYFRVKNNQLYKLDCIQIKEITIPNKTMNCYVDFPITFEIRDERKKFEYKKFRFSKHGRVYNRYFSRYFM